MNHRFGEKSNFVTNIGKGPGKETDAFHGLFYYSLLYQLIPFQIPLHPAAFGVGNGVKIAFLKAAVRLNHNLLLRFNDLYPFL